MFEFLKHNKPETLTVTSTETTPKDLENEMEDSSELIYKSPEYIELENQYVINSELFTSKLEEELVKTETENTEESTEYFFDDEEAVASSTSTEGDENMVDQVEQIEQIGQEVQDNQEENPQNQSSSLIRNVFIKGVGAVSLATVFSLAACDEEMCHEGRHSHSHDGHEEVEKHESSTAVVAKKEVDKKEVNKKESTDPSSVTQKGSGRELFNQYKDNLVPSGNLEKGYIDLNDKTIEAISRGVLNYYPDENVFALAVTKNPSKQGIHVKTSVDYILSKGGNPKPPIKGANFFDYAKRRPDGSVNLSTFDDEKYKASLVKSISKDDYTVNGKLNKKAYDEAVSIALDVGLETKKAFFEWIKANKAQREELFKKNVVPYLGRKGIVE